TASRGATSATGSTRSGRYPAPSASRCSWGFFFFQAEDGIRDGHVTGVQTCALPISADDERVKAIVLRVNSPGGGVTASDEVYGEIVRFKKERKVPVVAALGDLAASGGYYVACAADRIVAHPTTVTGPIGVIMTGPN